MSHHLSPIISAQELILLKQKTPLVLIDASAGADSKEKHNQHHLEGALYVDLNSDLANIKPDASQGGRHPLPSAVEFAKVLTKLGISPNSHVIIYDDKNSSNAAARFWWMLASIGHQKTQVLNGGYNAAVKAGFAVSSKKETPLVAEPYHVNVWTLPLSNINEVDTVRLNPDYLIIDVRDKIRYDGIKEPIDLIAGHIPGAVNIPFTSNLDSDGLYLLPDVLKTKYLKVLNNKNANHVIVHCGSGVTACHTLLAMAYAGLEIPKLYIGSWSEWSRLGRPIEKNIG